MIKIIFFGFLSLILSLFLSACDGKSEDYYKAHPDEAKARAKECKEKTMLSEDCINAFSVGIGSKNESSSGDVSDIPSKENVLSQ